MSEPMNRGLLMHLGAVAVAGLLSGALVVAGVYLAAALEPDRVRLNPFHFLGSAVFVDEGSIYRSGAAIFAGLTIVVAAVQVSLHRSVGAWLPPVLWGVLFGIVQYGAVGAIAGFSRTLHPAVRTGDLPDPGAFASKQPRPGMFALPAASVLFSVLVALLYAWLS